MNPRVKNVRALENYTLEIEFDNGEKGQFSMKPYLEYPVYASLKDDAVFKQATATLGFVSWNGEIDIDPDTLYIDSKRA
jgi:hypothetical protein